MPKTFSVIFFFDNPFNSIIEIKRSQPKDVTDPSKIYYWLLYEKKTHRVYPLQFISMKDEFFGSERVFKQGRFLFNEKEGTLYNSTDHGKMTLTKIAVKPVPKLLVLRIEAFLLGIDEQLKVQS